MAGLESETYFILDLRLDVVNSIRGLHLERDGLARERLDEDLRSGIVLGWGVLGAGGAATASL